MNQIIKNFFLLIVVCILACQTDTTSNKNTATTKKINLSKVLADYYEGTLQLNPLNATFAGDTRFNDQFPNFNSQEYINEFKAFYTKTKQTLADIDKSQLSANDRMSYEILDWDCTIALQEVSSGYELTPIDQMWSANLMVGQLASGASAQPFVTPQDYDNWLKRVDGYIEWCESAIANMRTGMEKGIVLPKALIVKVIPQFADLGKGGVEKHLFYQPIASMPDDFSAKEKERITALTPLWSRIKSSQPMPKWLLFSKRNIYLRGEQALELVPTIMARAYTKIVSKNLRLQI